MAHWFRADCGNDHKPLNINVPAQLVASTLYVFMQKRKQRKMSESSLTQIIKAEMPDKQEKSNINSWLLFGTLPFSKCTN